MELGSWPRSERPRERLLETGPQSLSDGELLAILLGTGIPTLRTGFWQPMDTLRDKNLLEDLWASGKAPWKVWE